MWDTNAKTSRGASADERRAMIVDEVNRRTSIRVADICEHFGVSAVTARSDLAQLERAGKLRRTHGGAVSIMRTATVSYPTQRVDVNVDAKRIIAQRAAQLVTPGDALFVDSGTTTLEFVRMQCNKPDITIVTNDLPIALFADTHLPRADVLLLGGNIRKNHRYVTGAIACGILDTLALDKAFLATESFDPEQGFTTECPDNAELKYGMLNHAKRRIMLMDATKLRQPSFMRFATLEDIDAVVMDYDPDGIMARSIERAKASVLLVAQGDSIPAGMGSVFEHEELLGVPE